MIDTLHPEQNDRHLVDGLFRCSCSYDIVLIWSQFHSSPWWRHQMETFSALPAMCAGNPPVTGEFPAQRPVTRSFDVFFMCVEIKCWVNNHEAGDLRCHRAHYDVIVMLWRLVQLPVSQLAMARVTAFAILSRPSSVTIMIMIYGVSMGVFINGADFSLTWHV